MKRKLQTSTSRLVKLVGRRLEALLEAIGQCSEAADDTGLISDLAAFGPVLEMLRDTIEGREPVDRTELIQWQLALECMEPMDCEDDGGYDDGAA